MTARLLTQEEAEPIIERLGGLEKLRRESEEHDRNLAALDRYLSSNPYDEGAPWVAFWQGQLAGAAPTAAALARQLRARGISPAHAVMYRRIPPGVRLILRVANVL